MHLLKFKLTRFFKPLFFTLILAAFILSGLTLQKFSGEKNNLILEKAQFLQDRERLAARTDSLETEIEVLKNEDLRKTNEGLKKTIEEVGKTFKDYTGVVEKIADARSGGIKTSDLEKQEAEIVRMLAELNYASASAKIIAVGQKIDGLLAEREAAIAQKAASQAPPAGQNVPVSQSLPTSSYSRQMVSTDRGSFLVDIVAAQVGSTRVIVDTASDEDCSNNCPVLPLATYVQRNGGFAGINGSYFCPAEYPSCVGRTNSYDTLAMNSRTKKYFNSENNKFSTVPLVAFDGGGAPIFKMQTVEWGRDTGVQAVLANHPMLVLGGNVTVPGGLSDKQQIKSNRSVVASKGGYIFLMVVHSASVGEAAAVMKTLGIDNALNLDSGGSTALYSSGAYKVGPGRNLPNAIIFAQ
ncbi:MAG: phosphodiester glycosidase family protein [bacterium]|nr:phosphodiester glycosidase family protein [bacterium]